MIVKSKTFTKFAVVSNVVCRDENLSLKAKGLFLVLASLPSDWIIYKTQLQQFSSDGRDATINAFDELVEQKYILAVQKLDAEGKFNGWNYIVYPERQVELTGKPITEKAESENPKSELRKTDNGELTNTDTTNKEKINTYIERASPSPSVSFSSLNAIDSTYSKRAAPPKQRKPPHEPPTQPEVLAAFKTFCKRTKTDEDDVSDERYVFWHHYTAAKWKLPNGLEIDAGNIFSIVGKWMNKKKQYENREYE